MILDQYSYYLSVGGHFNNYTPNFASDVSRISIPVKIDRDAKITVERIHGGIQQHDLSEFEAVLYQIYEERNRT